VGRGIKNRTRAGNFRRARVDDLRGGDRKESLSTMQCETVPDNLREASLEELLYLALACDSGGDLLTSGLESALVDLEVLHEALEAEGDRWAANAVHQVQTRLRVVQELARRRASEKSERSERSEGSEAAARARGRPGREVRRAASG
jgi:hypothetical protein